MRVWLFGAQFRVSARSILRNDIPYPWIYDEAMSQTNDSRKEGVHTLCQLVADVA